MHLICCTYPATSANFNTNYVIFKKVESFLKNYQRKKNNSRKIWNCHECFICENENSKLINYSKKHVSKLPQYYGYLVIGPMELENIMPLAVMCWNFKHEVKFSDRFCEISATVSTPKCPPSLNKHLYASRFFNS